MDPPISVRRVIATQVIDSEYSDSGGRLGYLGHPRSGVTLAENNTYFREFEGGALHVTANGEAINRVRWQTTVRYKGMHCFGETGGLGSDEPYVVVSVYAAGKRENAVVTSFGPYEDVDDGTTKIDIQNVWTDEPPADLVVNTMILEHDAGSPEDVVNEVVDALRRGADALDAANGAGQWANDFLGSGFFGDILGGIGSLLGLGDNPIGAEGFVVTYPQSVDLFDHPMPIHRIDELEYRKETPLISDGDASYKAYFDVFTDKIVSGQIP